MSNQRVTIVNEGGAKKVTVSSLGTKECLDVSLKDSSGNSLDLSTETKQNDIIVLLTSISNTLNI